MRMRQKSCFCFMRVISIKNRFFKIFVIILYASRFVRFFLMIWALHFYENTVWGSAAKLLISSYFKFYY